MKKESFWIPYADLMTLLMVVFLFISAAFMILVEQQKKDQDRIVKDYQESKLKIYQELNEVFKTNKQAWEMEIDNDLSIRFTNPAVLFPLGESKLTPRFEQILAEFFAKYLAIVSKEEYSKKIAEIRIEGHTDISKRVECPDQDNYLCNLQLSQMRSTSVMKFMRNLDAYKQLGDTQKLRLDFWFTANGLSFGRMLDADKQLVYATGKQPDLEKSRRVEIRIVTTSDLVIDSLLAK
jgi:outer membrane protein OmpA-like peptidoglycan-associated protein